MTAEAPKSSGFSSLEISKQTGLVYYLLGMLRAYTHLPQTRNLPASLLGDQGVQILASLGLHVLAKGAPGNITLSSIITQR